MYMHPLAGNSAQALSRGIPRAYLNVSHFHGTLTLLPDVHILNTIFSYIQFFLFYGGD